MVIKSKLKIFPHELLNLQRNIESVNYDLVSNQRQMLVIIHAFAFGFGYSQHCHHCVVTIFRFRAKNIVHPLK